MLRPLDELFMKQRNVYQMALLIPAVTAKILQFECQRTMPTIRVAVAGTCGLALLIAREIHESTSHQLVILSRTVSHSSISSMRAMKDTQ